jgi:hypothetical protein
MEQLNSKNAVSIFKRHPMITIGVYIILLFVILDFIVARICIPPDYNDYRRPDPWYHHGFQPGVSALSKWGEEIYQIHINSLGFIDKSTRDVPLKSQRHRVLIIGDSFTEGRGIFYTQTFPGLIEASLEPKGFEVFNAAVSSYSPKLYYLKVKYLLEQMKFRFDELIVFIDISDIQDEIIYEKFEPQKIPARVMFIYKVRKYMERNSVVCYLLTHVVRDSKPGIEFDRNIFPQLRDSYKEISSPQFYRKRENWSTENEIYESMGKKGLALAEKNMDRLYRLCRQQNIRMSIAVYPWPAQIARHDVNGRQEQFWRNFCERRGLNFIDLYPLFINKEDPKDIYMRYFIYGDIHWNREGHKLIARKVLESL